MRKTIILALNLASFDLLAQMSADSVCKNLKSCAEWVQKKTNVSYELGKFEKRSLKTEKEMDLSEGDPDALFSFILSQSEFTRIKRENGSYEIISLREIKDFTFPIVKDEKIRPSLDIQAAEFHFSNKIKLKNALIIVKKMISKNGRVVEASDGTKLFITDTGFQLFMFKNLISTLN